MNTDQDIFYDGRGFPLHALSPDEFEEFVFGCLLCVQDILGLRITGKPSGPGDGGFDVQGEIITSNRLVCIQCKRQEKPLGTAQVAKELAKVAATAVIEGSDIGEHKFICTGGIAKTLRKQLRERPLNQLAIEAGSRLANDSSGDLSNLKLQLETAGFNPKLVAESYVLKLDTITVWDSLEFDAVLSPRWTDVLKVIERFFRVSTVVREYPRAIFDRQLYLSESIAISVLL